MLRGGIDRFLSLVAKLAAHMAFRSIEREGFAGIPRRRPTIVVANHFNGFVDPILVVDALGRLPRFLAKATLWKVWIARPFLRLAGIIPVYRAEDGATAANVSTFAAAHRVLARDGTIAIFPEGTTHDEPRLVKVRTGAARIALGAFAAGVRGIQIVPVGLTFEDKVALRSRVLLQAGPPIDLDDAIPAVVPDGAAADEDDHQAVNRLTELIAGGLRAVAPDFDTPREAGALSAAAEVALRTDATKAPAVVALSAREALARRLADAPDAGRDALVDELANYTLDLSLADVTDEQLVPRPTVRSLLGRLVVTALIVAILSPFAIGGVVMNVVPALVVAIAGMAVRVPVTKGTVRLLVGIVVFPLTWLAFAIWDGWDGYGPGVVTFVTAPILAWAAIVIVDRIRVLGDVWRAWRIVTSRRGQLRDVLAARDALVIHVRDLESPRAA